MIHDGSVYARYDPRQSIPKGYTYLDSISKLKLRQTNELL